MFKSASRLPFSILAAAGLPMLCISCGTHCGVADAVSVLDSKDGTFLVYRVTGSQEKLEFFELYRSKPEFDLCGTTSTTTIAKEPYFRSEGLLKNVEVRGGQLKIVYTHDASDAIQPQQARLSP